jgi:succinate-semialdehyde dehydrogenase / glutarate-semialdehyde dehydrogenase
VLKQPIGVVRRDHAVELPAAMITRKAGPALAAGCTIVSSPRADAALGARARRARQRAGIPAGVFSVVTGGARAIGGELTSNPLVRKLASPARPRSASC